MKKIFTLVMLLALIMLFGINAKTLTLNVNNGYITEHTNSSVIEIPKKYELKGTEFRAAWVSTFTSDIGKYTSPLSWRGEVGVLIKTFKEYNLNTMIFHIRTHNNAMYNSELNPIASWWWGANFEAFDPLEYLIDECHKAGIEFHAWMNPYRISTNTSDVNKAAREGQYLGGPMPDCNPAKDPANLIAGSGGVILNPGLPNVRDFIVDTCMEVIEKYDVDAIHFDDYFYISKTEDSETYAAYNPDGLSLADWRREQVNLFMEQLHNEMTTYNEANNRHVQLGISPSGIYKNGDGTLEGGSATSGFSHYGDYLYSDTYKWAKEGWIDYLIPQSYWSFDNPHGPYGVIMEWWNRAFEGLDCLLYSGIGVYMASENNTFGWYSNLNEFTNQLKYLTALENVSGYSIYKYSWLKKALDGDQSGAAKQIRVAKAQGCFDDVALNPVVKSMDEVKLGKIENFLVKNQKLTWNHIPEAKAYAIYRSDKELTYDQSEIVALVGAVSETAEWKDDEKGAFNYGVRAISGTNTLGEINKEIYKVVFLDGNGEVASELIVSGGSSVTAPRDPKKEGYIFKGWDQDFTNIQSDMVINPIFEEDNQTPPVVDCDKNPDHEDCKDDPTPPVVDCDKNPDHEDCKDDPTPPVVDCDKNPDHEDCKDEPLPPVEDKKGCKEDLAFVVMSIVSLTAMALIIKKKER